MGQQQPLIPGQGGFPAAGGASGMPDMSSMLAGMTPEQLQQGMAALADPKMMAQVQQALANPNAGDMFSQMGQQAGAAAGQVPGQIPGMPPGMNPQDPMSMLPISPQGLAAGAVGGVAMGYGLNKLAGINSEGKGPLLSLARGIDRLPGINRVSTWIENSVLPRMTGDAADRMLLRVAPEVAETQLVNELVTKHGGKFAPELIEAADKLKQADVAAGAAVRSPTAYMKDAIGARNNSPLHRIIQYSGKKGTEVDAIKGMAEKMIGGAAATDADKAVLEKILAGKTSDEIRKVMTDEVARRLPAADAKLLSQAGRMVHDVNVNLSPAYRAHHRLLEQIGHTQLVKQNMPALLQAAGLSDDAIKGLSGKAAKQASAKAAELAKATTLHQVNAILGKKMKDEAVQTVVKGIQEKSVGPIGRSIISSGQTFNRVFSGEMMRESMTLGSGKKAAQRAAEGVAETAAKEGGGLFSKFLGPALMGAVTLGTSFTTAQKAEKGDKLKTFFHDFLGVGIGGFLGWEIGRNLLRKTNIIGKLVPFASKALPFLKRWPTFNWGFLIIEALSMFVIAKPFEKAGSKISDMIFGKPQSKIKEEQEKAAAKAAKNGGALPGQQPGAVPGMPQAQPGQPPIQTRRGIFNQFSQPQQAAAGGITVPLDDIRNNPAQAADAAALGALGGTGTSMSMGDTMPAMDFTSHGGGNGTFDNMFMPGGGH